MQKTLSLMLRWEKWDKRLDDFKIYCWKLIYLILYYEDYAHKEYVQEVKFPFWNKNV